MTTGFLSRYAYKDQASILDKGSGRYAIVRLVIVLLVIIAPPWVNFAWPQEIGAGAPRITVHDPLRGNPLVHLDFVQREPFFCRRVRRCSIADAERHARGVDGGRGRQ